MTDKNYIECGDCRKRMANRTVPDVCKSIEAIEAYGKIYSRASVYCEDINRKRDCKFQKLNLHGLIGKILSEL
ncbi:Uncharacterised protein [uncultured archaeon]|nr:Uncharacterised protein [uncultured archaeon]